MTERTETKPGFVRLSESEDVRLQFRTPQDIRGLDMNRSAV